MFARSHVFPRRAHFVCLPFGWVRALANMSFGWAPALYTRAFTWLTGNLSFLLWKSSVKLIRKILDNRWYLPIKK